jgi:hypothetical protein
MPAKSPPNSFTAVALGIGLGVAVLMVLACMLSFGSAILGGSSKTPALIGHYSPTGTSAPSDGGLGFATQSPDPTPLPYTYPTPTVDLTQTGQSTQTAGGQATLQVSRPICNRQSSAIFVVSSVGNGLLVWQATSPQPVNIQPSSGVINQNHSNRVNVTFAGTLQTGIQVTISAQPNNQQQTVIITCRPLP